MSPPDRPSRQRPARPSRRDRVGRVVLLIVVLVLAFLLGMAFARTLDERPKSSGTVTSVRTLTPISQARTVIVTVTGP
jgi:hypothetical protein